MVNLDDLIPENMRLASQDAQPETKWSPFQEAIYSAAQQPDNLVIEAVAGSGKTTTILEAMRRLGSKDVLFLAFNKSIQEELAARVPMGVTARTLNSLGYSVLSPHLNVRKVQFYKPSNILRDMLRPEVYKDYGWDLAKLLSSARAHGIGIRTALDHSTWLDFLLQSSMMVPDDSAEQFAEILRMAFDRMLAEYKDNFDFDDQLYLPIFFSWTFPRYDVVFVDEAQDLSYINHMQLQALSKRGAQIIAVGDSHQAIYAFRGADTRSMHNLAEKFSARTLPLSVCYRCGKSIVRHAQRLVPHIEYAEDKPEGSLVYHEEYPAPAEYEQHSMIICRNNAPLFSLALQFLREKVPCHVVNDTAADLVRLIDKLGDTTTVQLAVHLQQWADKEIARAERLGRDHLISAIEDKVACLLPFFQEYQYAIQVKAAIKQLLESTYGPRISTIHKAKGLEADHVYLLRPDLLPSSFALRALEAGDSAPLQQEENLEYVAITRAKLFLHYLPRGK